MCIIRTCRSISVTTDYMKFRGKCKELSEELCNNDKTLTLVRGWYYEPFWSREEQHWWCKKPDGEIVDPASKQFPSGGIPEFYREFTGQVECSECGKSCDEEDMNHASCYSFCSSICYGRFVGVVDRVVDRVSTE